jgi:hypothetical protein
MKLEKAINCLCYGSGKPTESISDARWRAMVSYINRYHVDKNGEYRYVIPERV